MAARWRKLVFLAPLLLAVAGCTTLPPVDPGAPIVRLDNAQSLIDANHKAVDRMLKSLLSGKEYVKGEPVIVASLVNVDDLTGSRFGKTVSEQLATRLTEHGYRVVELKLRGNIFVRNSDGELLLSRELKDISLNQRAPAVLVGTYAETGDVVYVTIKMVEASTGQSIAAHDYAIPADSWVQALLPARPRR